MMSYCGRNVVLEPGSGGDGRQTVLAGVATVRALWDTLAARLHKVCRVGRVGGVLLSTVLTRKHTRLLVAA